MTAHRQLLFTAGSALACLALMFAASGCDDGGGGSSRNGMILALTPDPAAGAQLYADTCGADICHGSDGDSGPAADLSVEVPARSENELLNVMLDGSGDMLPLNLTDQQAADVLAHVVETF